MSESRGMQLTEHGSKDRLLRVTGLTLRFGGITALDDVAFGVGNGELLAIIGPNGAGKTSLFNCLNGVYRPQRGQIELAGESLVGRSPAAIAELGVARTFQNLELFGHLTLADNLMLGRHRLMRTGFGAGMLWWGRARREEETHRLAIEEIISLLDLGPYRETHAGLLPYGIAKRVELGRALAMEPAVLLLDEPVAGMNQEETGDIANYLGEIRRELGLTMLLVEHDMNFVMDISDRVVVLDFGMVIAAGQPQQIQNDSRVIEAYLGGGTTEATTTVPPDRQPEAVSPLHSSGREWPAEQDG